MKCCGKCYLRKQLKKVDDNSVPSNNRPDKNEKNEAVSYIVPEVFLYSSTQQMIAPGIRNPVIRNLYNSSVIPLIFHPPSASC